MKKIFDNPEIYTIDLTPDEYQIPFISAYILKFDKYIACIDVGCQSMAEKLMKQLDKIIENRKLVIIPTHIHLDHAGALGTILKEYQNSIAYIHPRGVKHIINPSKLWKTARELISEIADVWGPPIPAPENKVKPTIDGEEINIDNYILEILHTEGHASHHQSIYLPNLNGIFVGDSAGIYIPELNVITISIPEILDIYYESLHKMLYRQPNYIFYAHYSYASSGVDNLNEVKFQIERYLLYTREARNNPEILYQKIVNDESISKAKEYFKKSKIIMKLMEYSINTLINECLRIKTAF